MSRLTNKRCPLPLKQLLWLGVTAVMCFSSCKNENNIKNSSNERESVVLRFSNENLVGTSGENQKKANKWYIDGDVFTPNLDKLSFAIVIEDVATGKTVYSKVVPFAPVIEGGQTKFGVYQSDTINDIPLGEKKFYAFFAPNMLKKELNKEVKIQYYSPKGEKKVIPWSFTDSISKPGFPNSKKGEAFNINDAIGAAFPIVVERVELPNNGGTLFKDPDEHFYNYDLTKEGKGKTVFWETFLNGSPWKNLKLAYGNKAFLPLFSGSKIEEIKRTNNREPQVVNIPLYRDFARFQFYIGTQKPIERDNDDITIRIEDIAFLNFPTMATPSFRPSDGPSDAVEAAFASNSPNKEKAGSYNYAYTYYEKTERPSLKGVLYKNDDDVNGEIEFDKMVTNANGDYEVIRPQYVAPYIPERNSWQKSIKREPSLLIRVGVYDKKGNPKGEQKVTYTIPIGELGTTKQNKQDVQYVKAIYPNRDYKVFIALPVSFKQNLIFKVEPWNTESIDLNYFY